jgi:hypothetical protein
LAKKFIFLFVHGSWFIEKQGAGSREQGAGSRRQEAEGKKLKT